MCWATGGCNNTWNDPQTNTIFLCCSCIVFVLRQPRTVTCTQKVSKRAWRAKWCRLGTLNFSGNTLSSTRPFVHTKIYCLLISSKCQVCCSITLLLCMPTLSCGLATTPSSKCSKGVPSKNTRLQHTCLLSKRCTTPTTVEQRNFCRMKIFLFGTKHELTVIAVC